MDVLLIGRLAKKAMVHPTYGDPSMITGLLKIPGRRFWIAGM